MKSQAIAFGAAAISLAIFAVVAAGDTIELRDGRKISGSMTRQGAMAVIKGDDGSSITVALTDVVHVTLSDSTSPADAAKSEWLRVASQIKGAGDIQAIIDLHKKFLEKYPDAANAKDVREPLGVYQQLADAGAVKFHGQWMPPDQIEVVQRQWAEAAAPGLVAYQAGKFKEALAGCGEGREAGQRRAEYRCHAGGGFGGVWKQELRGGAEVFYVAGG